jgi:hypothetical protein
MSLNSSIHSRAACVLCLQFVLGCAAAQHDANAASPDGGQPDSSVVGQQNPGATGSGGTSAGSGHDASTMSPMSSELLNGCDQEMADSLDGLPQHLRCTGLYADLGYSTLGNGVQPYTPGIVLWSDGAEKHRWIYLPEGQKIDASSSGDWTFPIGTKLFKEFAIGTRRIETRFFQKVRDDHWMRTSFVWDAAGSDAVRSAGGDITLSDGSTYHVPTSKECDQCHQGRKDRILGFEAIGLGVAGADGLTLEKLVAEGLITPAPSNSHLQIADDGTGKSAEIIGWIHMNCGVSCHNDNGASSAHSTNLRLRLSPDDLDGPASDYPAISNTVNVGATTSRWSGQMRIVPGAPYQSLLYNLVASRKGKNDQMPPIASRIVDQPHVDALRAWIQALPSR